MAVYPAGSAPDVDVDVDVDVLIVGAGPVGMLGGILASRHGLTALVVERRDGPQTSPAAHAVNARTYEICRQAGLDMDRIHAAGTDRADSGHVNFVTRLNGELIGRLPYERQDDGCLDVTPTPLRNLSQHRFEPILADELRASPGAELRYRHRWEHSDETGDAVVSVITDLGTERTIRVRSRYLIGCDGAGSRVRKQLGIEMHGPQLIQCYLMIHFAADLRALTSNRPAVLHFVLDPACSGAFIAHDVDSDWVFMHAVDPGAESVDDYPADRCLDVIARAAGTALDAEILSAATWWMSAQTAESMGCGRTFLAGDAAHRFPPTGGLGLNSGVQDIHGLMWRIAAIATGGASTELLDSYGTERLPVARNNAHQSLTNAFKMVELAVAARHRRRTHHRTTPRFAGGSVEDRRDRRRRRAAAGALQPVRPAARLRLRPGSDHPRGARRRTRIAEQVPADGAAWCPAAPRMVAGGRR